MTDNSKEYIKMCLALPSGVTNNHQFATSDFVLQQLPETGKLMKSVTIVAFTYSTGKMYWIPKLDQLFEMAAEHNGTKHGLFTLRSFKLFTDQQLSARHDWGLIFPTLEQMALCYVMHEIHGMTWTGEKWEKEA